MLAPAHTRIVGIAVVAVAVGFLAVVLLLRSDSTSSTTQGSGHAVTQQRTIGAFTRVELAGSNNVSIAIGSRPSVVVHGDDNLVGRVTTAVRDGRLVIGNTHGGFSPKSPMYVDVTVPSLASLILSGSGNVSVSGLAGPTFAIDIRGSGVVNAAGSTDRLDVSVPGSGVAHAEELVAKRVRASVAGSGMIGLTATESLDAAVPGSGAILYRGNPPHVTSSVTGSGAVKPA